MILPAGAIITRIALRLPATETNKTTQYGNLPVGRTLVGTAGELVKVGATGVFTTIAPSVAAAPNASATAQRPFGAADVVASGLVTLGAATTYSLLVSNAGSTAAGTGIATSAAGVEALAIVQICCMKFSQHLSTKSSVINLHKNAVKSQLN